MENFFSYFMSLGNKPSLKWLAVTMPKIVKYVDKLEAYLNLKAIADNIDTVSRLTRDLQVLFTKTTINWLHVIKHLY